MALTIRPTETFNKAVEKIKKQTDIKSTSKVIEYSVLNLLKLKKQLNNKTEECQTLTNQINIMQETLLEKEQANKNYDEMITKIKNQK